MGRIQLTLKLTRKELETIMRWLEEVTNEPHKTATANDAYIYQFYGPGWQAGFLRTVPHSDYEWGSIIPHNIYTDQEYEYRFHLVPEIACLLKLTWQEHIVIGG